MYGKSATSIHGKKKDLKPNSALALGLAALLIAILGLFTPNANLLSGLLPANCSTGVTTNSALSYNGVDGVDGISAFAVWQNQGNDGDEAAFLKSLVGTKGTAGYSGKDGKSSYQLWLDAGNSGTSKEFLDSLIGKDGVAGLSAYDLWLATGHNGTLQQFLDSLVGAAGAPGASGSNGANGSNGASGSNGANGSAGLSAFEIWRENGHSTGTVTDFLNSLKGADGTNGTNGTNGAAGANGTNGTNGVDGAVGPSGPAGVAGSPGAPGADGICTIGTGGYYASFWDQQTQTAAAATNGMLLGYTGASNGVTAVLDDGVTPITSATRGSWIKFDHAGTYNIAFSAQLAKSGGSGATISIWLQRYNGAIHNVEYTNTNVGLANNSTELVAAWNFFVDVAEGDRVRLAWHSTDSSAIIEAKGPVTNGIDIPGIPSVIVTVNQVR